jgi:hypothetical protein
MNNGMKTPIECIISHYESHVRTSKLGPDPLARQLTRVLLNSGTLQRHIDEPSVTGRSISQFTDGCFEHAIRAVVSPVTELHGGFGEESADDVMESGIDLRQIIVMHEIEEYFPLQFRRAIAEHAPYGEALRKNQTAVADRHDQIAAAIEQGLEPRFASPESFLRRAQQVGIPVKIDNRIDLTRGDRLQFFFGVCQS